MDDETLIGQFYECQDAAFAQLYDRYLPQLVALVRRTASSNAEDVAEDAFLRVVRTKQTGSGRFDPQQNTSFRTWLFTVARNALRDHLRREAHQPEAGLEAAESPAEEPVTQVPWEEPDTVLTQAAELFAGPVGECLAELNETLRVVLLLDLVGENLTEIGERLGISYSTAGTRLHRARSRMRASLQQRGFEFVPVHSVPPGAEVIMTFPDQVLVRISVSSQEGEQ